MARGGAAPAIRWTNPISPTQVLQLIRAEKNTHKALAIFDAATAEYSNGYRHDHRTFSLTISRLASSKLFSAAEDLLSRMTLDRSLYPIPDDEALVSVLHAYARANRPLDALCLFHRMGKGSPFEISLKSYVTVFDALVEANQLKLAHRFYKDMKGEGVQHCVAVYNVLIKAFCKSERTVDAALKVFGEMPARGCEPDSYTYGTLINGLCRIGRVEKALQLLDEMGEKGCSPSVITYTSLMHGYCITDRLDEAGVLLATMNEKGVKPNVVTYSTMVDGLCKRGRSMDAVGLLDKMVKERCVPNMITYSSLVDGLCREGKIKEASEVVDRMRLHGRKPDAGLYGKLIKGLVGTGKHQEAANFLDEMMLSGVKPNRLTWGVHIRMHNVVLQGLCEGNDPNRAFQVYLSMKTRGISVDLESYSCLVDSYCKKAELDKAAGIVNDMLVEGCAPDRTTWNAIVDSHFQRKKARETTASALTHLMSNS